MSLFSFQPNKVLTSYSSFDSNLAKQAVADFNVPNSSDKILLAKDVAKRIVRQGIAKAESPDLSKQFVTFQLADKAGDAAILESSQVTPKIIGSDNEPDVLVALEMLSFHIGKNEAIDKDTRATMRINIGKDENSRDKNFDTAFWSIAAGLNLYNQHKNKITEPKDLNSDFKKAFGNRPIEIPGGLGKMSFEVVKHTEPAWWQKLFGFLKSETGKSMVSAVGFPAITSSAINILDELLNRLTDSKPEVLFKSMPLRLALSQQARDYFTGGNERIKMGCLNPGFCILARGEDFNKFIEADCVYYPNYGILAPSDVTPSQLVTGKYDNPFADTTYSIFKVGMKSTKLDPTFNYS